VTVSYGAVDDRSPESAHGARRGESHLADALGRGIVATQETGNRGRLQAHPGLLDRLAVWLV
jgi:hypothetical protein